MKKSLLIILMLPFFAQSQSLIFNGVEKYDNIESPLGVKIYRGEKLQNEYSKLQENIKTDEEKTEDLRKKILSDGLIDPLGNYSLSNIPEIKSNLTINKDGSFYWSMNYEDLYLSTYGNWHFARNNQDLILNTEIPPKEIPFKFNGSEKLSQMDETKSLGNGNLKIKVSYPIKSELERKGGIKDVIVECVGMQGNEKVKTNEFGEATCNRVGYPIRKITLKYDGLDNVSSWINPSFKGSSWNFTFDLSSAHTDYFFSNEKLNFSNGDLIWNGRSLGANQEWIYKK